MLIEGNNHGIKLYSVIYSKTKSETMKQSISNYLTKVLVTL